MAADPITVHDNSGLPVQFARLFLALMIDPKLEDHY